MDDPSIPVTEGPLFEEVQKFRQPWVMLLVFGVGLFTIGLFGYGLYEQLYLGRPWGDQPMSDTGLLVFSAFIVALMLLLMVLVVRMTLTVQVQGSGHYIRYWPVIRRFIPWDRIDFYEAVTYHPILEYGGWGIRGFRGNMAYNVSGNQGVRLLIADQRKLLIGSQQPERLAEAIRMASGMEMGVMREKEPNGES